MWFLILFKVRQIPQATTLQYISLFTSETFKKSFQMITSQQLNNRFAT